MKRNRDEEEEERLINVKVVEYLEPLISRELLCKFPDNSAFDFDYSKSSIWSPMIPRVYSPVDLDWISPVKLSTDFAFGVVELEKKSIGKSAKKKQKTATFSAFGINLCSLFQNKKEEKKIRASEFSHAPIKNSCLPLSSKGWEKVLKAKAKTKTNMKKKDSGMHVKLTNCLIKKCLVK